MNRWEWIEGIRAETPSRVAVRELGKVLVSELEDWPPAIEWTDEATRHRYAEIFTTTASRPPSTVLAECLRLVRWELARDFDAIEHYERNHHLQKACPAKSDALTTSFLRSYFTEAFFDLMERTENRVTRRDLLAGMDELEQRLKRAWQERN